MKTASRSSTPHRVDYGLDAPRVVGTFAMLGTALLLGGLALARSPALAQLGGALLWPGASFAITATLMWASSRVGKLRARDRLLDRLSLRGDETVLDVGCGHGLLLLGAAHRLPRGRAIGVDLWSQRDQQDNSADATRANADTEGVRDRVDVRDGDMRALPLDDATVDAVISSLAVHNLPDAPARATAVREMIRVTRPGGRVAILDIANVGAYAELLTDAGFVIERNGYTPWIFPPTRELIARKPS